MCEKNLARLSQNEAVKIKLKTKANITYAVQSKIICIVCICLKVHVYPHMVSPSFFSKGHNL